MTLFCTAGAENSLALLLEKANQLELESKSKVDFLQENYLMSYIQQMYNSTQHCGCDEQSLGTAGKKRKIVLCNIVCIVYILLPVSVSLKSANSEL